MIRSSKHTLKFTNKNKQENLSVFFEEYRRILSLIINDLWNNKLPEFNLDIQNNKLNCPSLLPNDYLKNIASWFTARMKQCVGKQACSMIKAAIQKRRKQFYKLRKLQKEKKNTTFLQRKIDIRPLKRIKRKLTHWTYTLIKDKLVSLSETEGFCLKEVNNEFRSQRCSSCGWVRKANRKGKTFTCNLCDFTTDSDLNAASNLLFDLYEIPFWVRSRKLNRHGFYWNHDGLYSLSHEPIVHDTLKT